MHEKTNSDIAGSTQLVMWTATGFHNDADPNQNPKTIIVMKKNYT